MPDVITRTAQTALHMIQQPACAQKMVSIATIPDVTLMHKKARCAAQHAAQTDSASVPKECVLTLVRRDLVCNTVPYEIWAPVLTVAAPVSTVI